MEIKNRILNSTENVFPELQGMRRHLHANPELSFAEYETSAYIAQQLKKMGISFKDGVAGTGIVAHIEGKDPGAKLVALRADMDALPIVEQNDVPYRSKNDGIMHACGHDVHSACLLGAAHLLNAHREFFSGTVRLIFQPGEEKLPGGASLMIKEGVLENPCPKHMFGQHVYPELPAGKVGFRPGAYMASADELYITVKGKGGHAALPHKNVDPVLIASHIIIALQQLVSRMSKATTPTVLSIGKVIAKGATNVIPSEVKMEGTFRTFNEEWRDEAHKKMVKLAVEMAKSMGGDCEFDLRKGYPFLVNDEKTTKMAQKAATELLGQQNVVDLEMRMTAEDFAYYSQEVPSCFYRLGTSGKDGSHQYGVHHPKFDIDEHAMSTGSSLMAWLAICSMT